MANNLPLKTFTGALLFALLLSVAAPLVARAQDETATPTPTIESATPTEIPPTATLEPPTASETSASDTETPTATLGSPTETPSETATIDLSATATATIGSETPTSTPTETLSPTPTPTLGTPLQAAAFTTADVIWCPATVAVPQELGGMGCTLPQTSLEALRVVLAGAPPAVDGAIWIGTGYGDATNVTFDGSALGAMAARKLTFKGGWITTGGTIDPSGSNIGHWIHITGWANDLALNALNIDGITSGDNLSVVTSGKITLSLIDSIDASSGDGASLDNSTGTADVVVSNSTFNNNTAAAACGLVVLSDGAITLTNVDANVNVGCGADLNNSGGVNKNITVSSSDFNLSTSNSGLVVDSAGSLTLTSVTAEDNAYWGAYVDIRDGSGNITISSSQFDTNSTTGGRGLELYAKGNVTLTGVQSNSNAVGSGAVIYNDGIGVGNISISTSTFSSNASDGLEASSNGSIMLTTVTANGNAANGAALDNTTGTAGVTVSTSSFNSNTSMGIRLLSDGVITFTSITANSNQGTAGANLNNTSAATPKNVTLSGANEFFDNRETGLVINSKGLITTNDITSLENGLDATTGNGVSLNNTFGANPGMGITLNGTNYLSGNYHHGVVVNSFGPIKLNNAFANSSVAGYGAYLINNSAATSQSITLTGSSQFNYNSLTGLLIQSHGAVMLNNVTANGSATGDGAFITNDYAPFTAGVTLTGANVFLENSFDGIEVYSRGAIAASNVTADDNGGYGLYFGNYSATTNMAATLSGLNSVSDNALDNVVIESKGVISVASLTANDSTSGSGIVLNNTFASTGAKMGVNITGINVANNNGQSGVQVLTHGAIVATTISASNNGFFGGSYPNGIYFANDTATTPLPVTLNGTNVLNDNTQDGLEIYSDGVVKANSVTANSNSGLGLIVANTGSSAGSVTLTGTNSFDANAQGGVQIDTAGPIALNNVSADGNASSHGISLTNTYSGAGTPKNVTLTGINTANGNWRRGLQVASFGDISVASLSANGNGVGLVISFGQGAVLDNFNLATIAKKITFTGTNSFSNNFEAGADLRSRGVISLNNVTASGNDGGYGVYAFNAIGGGGVGVTLTGINAFNDNAEHGLYVNTDGPITASSLRASGNLSAAHQAIYLYNAGATAPQNVTVSGVNIMTNNAGTGVQISTKGTVSVASMTSTGSANGYGLYIDNITSGTATVPKSVTLTGTNNISGNALTGLDINTYGPVSIATLTASNNGNTGADIVNATSSAAQNVSFTGLCYFVDNDSGLIVNTKGAISSSLGMTAINNTFDGVFLNNAVVPATPTDVTILGTNKAIGNGAFGFRVISHGMITANNLTASGNSSNGVDLNNNSGSVVKDLKLTGTNVVTGNTLTNINLYSLGAISVNNLTASGSLTGNGADILNLTEGKGITFTGSTYFNLNDEHGALINTLGNFVGNNMNASLNGQGLSSGLGLQILNESATTPRSVTLTGTNVFIDNFEEGLNVFSKGIVTLNNVRSHLNSLGLLVDNDAGTAAVNLLGVNSFRNNTNYGLRLRSLGAMTVNKLTVDNNGSDGFFIDATAAAVNVMCGAFTANTGNGIDIASTGAVKFVGVVAAGNANPQVNFAASPSSFIVVRTCP